jgi:hypothetical protein
MCLCGRWPWHKALTNQRLARKSLSIFTTGMVRVMSALTALLSFLFFKVWKGGEEAAAAAGGAGAAAGLFDVLRDILGI